MNLEKYKALKSFLIRMQSNPYPRFSCKEGYYYNDIDSIPFNKILKTLSTIKFKDINIIDTSSQENYSEKTLNSNLVIIDNSPILIHHLLDQIIFYYIIYSFRENINSFIDKLDFLVKSNKIELINRNDETYCYYNLLGENNLFNDVQNIKNTIDILMNLGNCIENITIYKNRVEKLLDNLKYFDFSKINLLEN